MGAEANTVASLLEKLKVDDPWVPPKPWESVPSEGGGRSSIPHSSAPGFYNTSNLSEASLVRLVMNALQGVESALVSVYEFSVLFCSESADRTFHRISSLWTRSTSTHALGNLLKSIGQFGCVIFLLQNFVEYFNHLNLNKDSGSENISKEANEGTKRWAEDKFGVINQAFAVAVKKILDSYISSLNTLYASASLRCSLDNTDYGCLTSVGNSEVTVLEVYLHTSGLRTQIEALGNICQIYDLACSFSGESLQDLVVNANLEFAKFPRGANLLTFLYMQLKVVDPIHITLLKFLFLQTFEPYYRFVRSWIYEGRMTDHYKEFAMEYVEHLADCAPGKAGISVDLPISTIKARDGVTLPCFLEDFLSPLLRIGQQLQVLVKLLDLCLNLGSWNKAQEEILPFLDNPPNDYPFLACPLTFHKATIEQIVLARHKYYERMQEKVDKIFSKVQFRYPQASQYAVQHLYASNHGRNPKLADPNLDDSQGAIEMGERGRTVPNKDEANGACCSENEFSESEDSLAISDSSSVASFQEQNDTELSPNTTSQLIPSYLSSLVISFSAKSAVQDPSQSEIACSAENNISEIWEKIQSYSQCLDAYKDVHHQGKDEFASCWSPQCADQRVPFLADSEPISDEYDLHLQPVHVPHSLNTSSDNSKRLHMSTSGVFNKIGNFEDPKIRTHFTETIFSTYALPETTNNQLDITGGSVLSSSWYLQPCNGKYGSNFLSMNPLLSKAYWINSSNKPQEQSKNYREPFSSFDFTLVRDPRKVCEEKLASASVDQHESNYYILKDNASNAAIFASANHIKQNCSDENSVEGFISSPTYISLDSKSCRGEEALRGHTAWGKMWEHLLACFDSNSNSSDIGCWSNSMVVFDMPLDYVIKKCLWEEILLQYQYVSKLTLKLLEEGFSMQEHLLTLRRYHFMEHADWADLFIFSLWHHKWHVAELEKRILEIQGVLELSIQRSSCEGDLNKDRLYVYVKGDLPMPLSASANVTRICSLDFLGLGYRVDWPVNIILTPGALKIYSDIFNFLIQVKHAIFSLSEIWCSLKGLKQVARESCLSEHRKLKLQHISVFTQTRHQVNHFVSTLQQYVQSQLSHVSWCKFLNSLKHKVKDMMDFEEAHMEYLTESLHICFLSKETQSIANIIQSMLQCSVELSSCLIACASEVGLSGDDCPELPQIDTLRVREIKKTFTKNVKDLFLIYLRTPKHGEFGLSRFWEYLNYNGYYADDWGMQLHHV
ncbi:OLC1v1004952C1 [Oldenlandia corymbosa var. corymbosa]|uniref:OLC1v1004952C1 n=1 Tax=Oldenlandia corymbosa var. corymbosa TaxID=529605 RepID=A0AAV1DDJ8_OLDCO|nr:OLC1v1004952C1 [Oldenlandia corymbosa var. corymbosa]